MTQAHNPWIRGRRCATWVLAILLLGLAPFLAACDPLGDLQKKLLGQSTLPVITQITPSSGKPGTAIAVMGSNFGPQTGSLGFIDSGTGRAVTATVTSWADTTIVASVPTMDTATGTATVGVRTATGEVPIGPYPFIMKTN